MSKSAEDGDGFEISLTSENIDKNANSNDGSVTNSAAGTPSNTSITLNNLGETEKQISTPSSPDVSTTTSTSKPSGLEFRRDRSRPKQNVPSGTSISTTGSKSMSILSGNDMGDKSDMTSISSKNTITSVSSVSKSQHFPHSQKDSSKSLAPPVPVKVIPPTPSESKSRTLSAGSEEEKPDPKFLVPPPNTRAGEESFYIIKTLSDPSNNTETLKTEGAVDEKKPASHTAGSSKKPSTASTVSGASAVSSATTSSREPVKSSTDTKKPDTNSNKQNLKVSFAKEGEGEKERQKTASKNNDQAHHKEPAKEKEKPPQPKKKAGVSILDGLANFMTGRKDVSEVPSKASVPEMAKDKAKEPPKPVKTAATITAPPVTTPPVTAPTREFRDTASQTSDTNTALKSDDSTIRALNTAINKLKEARKRVEGSDKKKPVEKSNSAKIPTKEPPSANTSGKDNTEPQTPKKKQSLDLSGDLGPHFVKGSVDSEAVALPMVPKKKNVVDSASVKSWQNSDYGSIRKDSREFPPNFKPTLDPEIRSNDSADVINFKPPKRTGAENKASSSDWIALGGESSGDIDEGKPVKYPDIDELVRPHRNKNKQEKARRLGKGGKFPRCGNPCCFQGDQCQFQAYQCSIVGEGGDVTEAMLQQWVSEDRSNCQKCELFEYILRKVGESVLEDRDIRRAFKQHMDHHVQKALKEVEKICSWAGKASDGEADVPECLSYPTCSPYIKCRRKEEKDDGQREGSAPASKNNSNRDGDKEESDKKSGEPPPQEKMLDKEFAEPGKLARRDSSILENLSEFMTGDGKQKESNRNPKRPDSQPQPRNEDIASRNGSDSGLSNDDSTILAIKAIIKKLEDRRRQPDPENRAPSARSSLQDDTSQVFREKGNGSGTGSPRSAGGDGHRKQKSPRDNSCCWHGCYYYNGWENTCEPQYHYRRTSRCDARGSNWKENCNQNQTQHPGGQYNCYPCVNPNRSAVTVVCRSRKNGGGGGTGGAPQDRDRCRNNNIRAGYDACDRNHYVEIMEPYWIQNDTNDNDCGGDNERYDQNYFSYNQSNFYGCGNGMPYTGGNPVLNKYINDAIHKFMNS